MTFGSSCDQETSPLALCYFRDDPKEKVRQRKIKQYQYPRGWLYLADIISIHSEVYERPSQTVNSVEHEKSSKSFVLIIEHPSHTWRLVFDKFEDHRRWFVGLNDALKATAADKIGLPTNIKSILASQKLFSTHTLNVHDNGTLPTSDWQASFHCIVKLFHESKV